MSLPLSLQKIGDNPFAAIFTLRSIAIRGEHPFLRVVDGVLFDMSAHRLICMPAKLSLETYAIPEGTESIDGNALNHSETLTERLEEMESMAFYSCEALEEITLPDGLETLGDSTFLACPKLKTVILGRDFRAIKEDAFANCPLLTRVVLPREMKEIAADVFEGSPQAAFEVIAGSPAAALVRSLGLPFAEVEDPRLTKPDAKT